MELLDPQSIMIYDERRVLYSQSQSFTVTYCSIFYNFDVYACMFRENTRLSKVILLNGLFKVIQKCGQGLVATMIYRPVVYMWNVQQAISDVSNACLDLHTMACILTKENRCLASDESKLMLVLACPCESAWYLLLKCRDRIKTRLFTWDTKGVRSNVVLAPATPVISYLQVESRQLKCKHAISAL